jgi:outer membrane protein assembly factor BamB
MRCAASLCWLCLFLTTAPAEDWTRFRGPTGQGHSIEQHLPTAWNAATGTGIRWQVPLAIAGWSSPIVVGNRVYLSGTTDEGKSCHVLALDADSGQTIWDQEVLTQTIERKEIKNSYASPTPVTDGKRLYGVFADGSVAALELNSGEVAWINRDVKFYSRHGLGSSPVLAGELLIMPFDGSNRVDKAGNWPDNSPEEKLGWQDPWDKSFVTAYDTRTGRQVWSSKRGMSRIAHVTPLVMELDNRTQVISPAGDVIQGFDAQTGELLWTARNFGEGVTPSPATGDGMIFTSSGFGDTKLRAFRLGGTDDVTEANLVWEQERGVPTQPSLLYVSPLLYAISESGVLTVFEGASGDQVYQQRIGGNFSASPVYADGKIYLLAEDGTVHVIKPGPEFELLAKNSLAEDDAPCQASIAISNGRLFIRTPSRLYAIEN